MEKNDRPCARELSVPNERVHKVESIMQLVGILNQFENPKLLHEQGVIIILTQSEYGVDAWIY